MSDYFHLDKASRFMMNTCERVLMDGNKFNKIPRFQALSVNVRNLI